MSSECPIQCVCRDALLDNDGLCLHYLDETDECEYQFMNEEAEEE